MSLKYFVIILSILGIISLYFLSTFSQPLVIELQDIPEYEGKLVTVEGTVIKHSITSYGGQIIEIQDIQDDKNSSKTVIFIEEPTSIEYGDKIQATGKIQKYEGEWEIVVNDNRFVKILQKWQNITMPLWQLAEKPSQYMGINVNVTGVVDRLYDDYFYLIDAEGEHSIIVFYNPALAPSLSPGDNVQVAANFVYNMENFKYVLEADEEIHLISLIGDG